MDSDIFETEDLFSAKAYSYQEKHDDSIEGEDIVYGALSPEKLKRDARFMLKIEAYLLQLAYSYNKILSLSNSRTRILAHQVESTHRIVNSLNHRFLIADEVGLGKTIEAGLVIKEFIYRFNYKKILIVCPASLLFQWQSEMRSKFNETFLIMDRSLMRKTRKTSGRECNPWKAHDRIICSLDFIKSAAFKEELENVEWDSVIFDEAHRLRRDSLHTTQAYTVAEIISKRTRALLLLSATPFRGKLEELYFLIHLLDKNILGPFNSFYNDYCMDSSDISSLNKKISSVMIRRTKKEVGGFTRRHARTIKFELYSDERELYDETTRYVAEEFNRAMQAENRAVGFVMTVFQKLLDSSSHALHSALIKRKNRLQDLLDGKIICKNMRFKDDEPLSEDDVEDADQFADISLLKTREELSAEIATLQRLAMLAGNIESNKKGEKLVELIESRRARGDKKFLIFTQFKTTQDYLKEILSGYRVAVFNGSMNGDEKESAIELFKDDTEILIATEAGGEGRNMQFCNIIINYDLPWSPLKIEQRIGRLHRFGQKKDVHVYNFSTRDTVAERVLEVLGDKIRIFEDSIGTPDILLGDVEDEMNIGRLFMELASGRKSIKAVEAEIEGRVNSAKINYEKLSSLTLSERMDFNYDEYYRITLKERQFSNTRIENFVMRIMDEEPAVASSIGRPSKRTGLYPVRLLPGDAPRPGTFDSQKALDNESIEFLAFGHPVVDGLINLCQSEEFGGSASVECIKHQKKFFGMIFNYLVTYRSSELTQELVPVFIDGSGTLDRREIEELEKLFVSGEDFACAHAGAGVSVESVLAGRDAYFSSAGERIRQKMKERSYEISEDMDLHIDPELEKIKSSCERSLRELEEKLDLQQGQMKWYGRDMRSAISRTTNSIMKQRREMESLLAKYKGFAGVATKARLVSAGVIVSS